jgi:hypothetical protein
MEIKETLWKIADYEYNRSCGKMGSEEILWKISGTSQRRKMDRKWFVFHLGRSYMEDKDVHHSWLKGSYCFVLTKHEHGKLHGAGHIC